jgi:hypothetical protein
MLIFNNIFINEGGARMRRLLVLTAVFIFFGSLPAYANQPPRFNPADLGGGDVDGGHTFSKEFSVTDPDLDSVNVALTHGAVYEVYSPSPNLVKKSNTVNGVTRYEVRWAAPRNCGNGTHWVEVTANDGHSAPVKARMHINYHSRVVQTPPVFVAIPDRTVHAGEALRFEVKTTTMPQDYTEIRISGKPSGAAFTGNIGETMIFSWTPTARQTGDFPVTFTAWHNGVSASKTVKITVLAAGSGGGGSGSGCPRFTKVPPAEVRINELQTYTFDLAAVNCDGTPWPADQMEVNPQFTGRTPMTLTHGRLTWQPDLHDANTSADDYDTDVYLTGTTHQDKHRVRFTVGSIPESTNP